MNVLLVSPYRGAIFEHTGIKIQPLGLSYIASALQKAGHDINIVMLENSDSLPDFDGADIVGITSNTVQFNSGLRVAGAAKEAGKTVIMGGPHPTSRPEEALRSGYVDFVVRAEGEITVVELLEGLKHKNGFDPSAVKGLSWVDKESDRVIHNPDRPFMKELDALRFPVRNAEWITNNGRADLGNVTEYPVVTARGCPYNCKFCDVGLIAGKRFRVRSVKNTVDEIEYIVNKYNAKKILLVDDIINFDNTRLIELFKEISARGIESVRWVMGRGDCLISQPETAEIMAEAGVKQMFLGIESPNERILKQYKKGGKASYEVSLEAVNLLRANDIETWGAFLLGEPSETLEDIHRTIDFAKFINPGIAQFSILTPYPGTALWNEVENRITTRNWDRYDAMHSVYRHDYIQPEELEKILKKAYINFYSQPKRILKELLNKGHYGRPKLKKIYRILRSLKKIYGSG